jgi:hypothetical protein
VTALRCGGTALHCTVAARHGTTRHCAVAHSAKVTRRITWLLRGSARVAVHGTAPHAVIMMPLSGVPGSDGVRQRTDAAARAAVPPSADALHEAARGGARRALFAATTCNMRQDNIQQDKMRGATRQDAR